MFLIDSSVWIDYLHPRGPANLKARVRELLQRGEVVSCGVVVVELLRGARTEKQFKALNQSLSGLPQIPLDQPVIDRAARWGFMLERHGKQISTADLLIAAAAHNNARLLHADTDFEQLASVVGLDHERLAV